MEKIRTSSKKFVSGFGFSNGCALLALKNPPPLVPSSFDHCPAMPSDLARGLQSPTHLRITFAVTA